MAKTITKNGRKYIHSKNSNWYYRLGFVRTMKAISIALKVVMVLGIVLLLGESTAADGKTFAIHMITKSVIAFAIMAAAYLGFTRIDKSF